MFTDADPDDETPVPLSVSVSVATCPVRPTERFDTASAFES